MFRRDAFPIPDLMAPHRCRISFSRLLPPQPPGHIVTVTDSPRGSGGNFRDTRPTPPRPRPVRPDRRAGRRPTQGVHSARHRRRRPGLHPAGRGRPDPRPEGLRRRQGAGRRLHLQPLPDGQGLRGPHPEVARRLQGQGRRPRRHLAERPARGPARRTGLHRRGRLVRGHEDPGQGKGHSPSPTCTTARRRRSPSPTACWRRRTCSSSTGTGSCATTAGSTTRR